MLIELARHASRAGGDETASEHDAGTSAGQAPEAPGTASQPARPAPSSKQETVAERDARLMALFAERKGGSASYGSVDGDQIYGGMGAQTKRNMFRVI
ncbi:hypothetical protein OC842_003939 [Tilletia horrida]|uniref:Uncharacterized protein n=1 Tax=Tilletia horrida TaxID=155126 RepID=A0AAN6GBZ9_9BASI|nr:hypothetical protein OC842_003939 [Tilletia horrida]